MASSLSFAPICSFKSSNKLGEVTGNLISRKAFPMKEAFQNSKARNFQSLEVKAKEDSSQTQTTKATTKARSIVCADCDGNGAITCTQCEGKGVNLVDHFNGRFKAGGLCWLCRGKKDILCGSCNGAGFVGGFMSTFDE